MRPLSPETRLVFRSADPACGADEAAALAREAREWGRVMLMAEREMAVAPLWRLLERGGAAAVPDEVAAYLARSAMVSDFRMRHLSARLAETLQACAAQGVEVLLLKGAAVGAMSDATFRARPMRDLDLLVRPEDRERARTALATAGWTQTTDPVLHDLLREQHHEPPFLDVRMPDVRVELHHALFPGDHSFVFGESDLWRDAVAAEAPFGAARRPSAEHLLLHGCIHFGWQHMMQFGPWRTFRLLAVAVASPGFSWERFTAQASAARAATVCYWTLRLAERLSGLAVPAPALAALAPPTWPAVRDALERHFITGLAAGEGAPSPSVAVTRGLWRAAIRPKWSGHERAARWDPEAKWVRALGTASTESAGARLRRHLADYRRWWRFVTNVLGG